jgi:hypothetical protein
LECRSHGTQKEAKSKYNSKKKGLQLFDNTTKSKPCVLFVSYESRIEIWIFPFMTCRAYKAGSYYEDIRQAKANIVVAIGRIVVVPVRYGAVVGIVVLFYRRVSHG